MKAAISTRRQRGATLLVTLIMLVVLTLFAVTGFNLSNVNLKIVGNYQMRQITEAVAQQAIENVITTVTMFNAPADTYLCIPSGTATTSGGTCGTGESKVTIDRPRCNYTTTARGYTKKLGELTPEDTNWDVRASYTDPLSGATAAIVQGVAVRMLAGNCPSWPY